jgi:hypothetical protein
VKDLELLDSFVESATAECLDCVILGLQGEKKSPTDKESSKACIWCWAERGCPLLWLAFNFACRKGVECLEESPMEAVKREKRVAMSRSNGRATAMTGRNAQKDRRRNAPQPKNIGEQPQEDLNLTH